MPGSGSAHSAPTIAASRSAYSPAAAAASRAMSSAARTEYRGEQNGSSATRARSPPTVSIVTTPPASGRATRPRTSIPAAAASGRTASNRAGLSWLPAITTTGRHRTQRQEGPRDHRLGFGRRRRRLVEVAGHDDQVDGLGRRDLGDLREHADVLGEPGLTADGLAHVPVGRVQDPHEP